MNSIELQPDLQDRIARRTESLRQESQQRLHSQTDRLFAALMLLQWIAGIGVALWLSPRAWEGMSSRVHPHVLAALWLGGLIAILPVTLAFLCPGDRLTRMVISTGQMLQSGLLIHLSGGRIETHFHIFGSLAFLSFYRDWRVLVPATLVVILDHAVRGVYWPESVYGVSGVTPWRTFEHTGWVLFEDVFLALSCVRGAKEILSSASRQAALETTNELLERQMLERVYIDIALRESEEQFRQLAESTNDVFWMTSLDGDRFLYVSPRYEQVWGQSGQRLYENSRDWMEAIVAEDRGRVEDALKTMNHCGEFDEEYRIRRPDGTIRWIHSRGGPVKNARGEIYRVAGVAEDVTERKEAEREAIAAKKVAEAANRSKSEFLANMSHEIRTPMTAILGYADMLLEPDQAPEDQRVAVQTIRRNGDHLLTVLNDILDISKVEAGKLQLEHCSVRPRHLIADILSLMRVQAQEKGLHLSGRFIGPIPEVIQTDPTRLRQILINLVGNAIKFTETGGINVIVSCAVSEGVAIPQMTFEVIDSGIGLTAEQLECLFQPFTQADASTTRRFGGTGLGLTICRRLAQMLAGDISAASRPGCGSRFVVTIHTGDLSNIPFESEGAEVLSPAKDDDESAPWPQLGGRILLAEDGPSNQEVIAYYLKKTGATVTVAENGRIARDMAMEAMVAGAPYDVILMDMQMPEMDGYTAAASLRSLGYDGPIIALTAHAMSQDKDKCIRSGCTGYLSKPIDRELMIATVSEYLSISRDCAPAINSAEGAAHLPDATLRSTLVGDEEMSQFLPRYIADLPEAVMRLESLLKEQDIEQLKKAIHQLKGTGGFYGFMPITDAAERIEELAETGEQIELIAAEVGSLVALIRSVEGYDTRKEVVPMS